MNLSINKRRLLNMNEKIELIKMIDSSPQRKKKDIAAYFGIPVNSVCTIYANKDKIFQQCSNSFVNLNMKKFRPSTYPEIEQALMDWYIKNVEMTGDRFVGSNLLREKALEFAKSLGTTGFSASNGWIERFRARHNITAKNPRRKTKNNGEKNENGSIENCSSSSMGSIWNPLVELKEFTSQNHETQPQEFPSNGHHNSTASNEHNVPSECEDENSSTEHSLSYLLEFYQSSIEKNASELSTGKYCAPTLEEANQAFNILVQFVRSNERATVKTTHALQEIKTFLGEEKKLKKQTKITDFFNTC